VGAAGAQAANSIDTTINTVIPSISFFIQTSPYVVQE
jgi:hypothetical protein